MDGINAGVLEIANQEFWVCNFSVLPIKVPAKAETHQINYHQAYNIILIT